MPQSKLAQRISTVVAAAALVGGMAIVAAPAASAASGLCYNLRTANSQGFGTCNVRSGEYRLRADCAFAPDTYSPWRGPGTWNLSTGQCAFSIRGVIVEARN